MTTPNPFHNHPAFEGIPQENYLIHLNDDQAHEVFRDFRQNANDHDEWAPFFMDTTDPDAEDRWNALMTEENIDAAISIYYYMLQLIWLPAHQKDFTHLTD